MVAAPAYVRGSLTRPTLSQLRPSCPPRLRITRHGRDAHGEVHAEYRTKRVILEINDALEQAVGIGKPYQTRLDPPPTDPRVAHPDTRPAAEKRAQQ